MAKKIAMNYDFLYNESKRMKIWSDTTANIGAASAANKGVIAFDTTLNLFKFSNGTAWIVLGNISDILTNQPLSASLNVNSQKIINLADPTAGTDGANKNYVDQMVRGLSWKPSVRTVATTNITLSGTQTINGVSLGAGDRVLLTGQTTQSQNGIYDVAAGAWSRSSDATTAAQLLQATVMVREGTAYADTTWTCTNNTITTVGTDNLVFAQASGAISISAGTGIDVTSNVISLMGQALALHNLATNGVIVRTGSGTVTARTITGHAGDTTNISVTVSNGDGVSGNPTLSVPTPASGGSNGTANTVARSDHNHDSTYAKKFVTSIGDGSSVGPFTVTHNTGNQYPDVRFTDKSSGDEVEGNITWTSTSAFSVTFVTNSNYTPAASGIAVTVVG